MWDPQIRSRNFGWLTPKPQSVLVYFSNSGIYDAGDRKFGLLQSQIWFAVTGSGRSTRTPLTLETAPFAAVPSPEVDDNMGCGRVISRSQDQIDCCSQPEEILCNSKSAR